jgi:D-alanyl-D-alanine carboxypeptidase/D-alanyl-D-alanine-endopeptidase (penicillin-binding protein 4)
LGFAAIDPEVQKLRNELEDILRSTGNRQGNWAVLAVSLDRHDTLLALNPNRPMVPASNMKLLSTAAALHFLGPDYRYRTFLLADGLVEEGFLDGDLILYGTGDPTFSERFWPSKAGALDSLASQLLALGISEVRGDLVVDGSFFAGPDLHPEWKAEDLNDDFAAPVAALSISENLVTVRVEAGSWVGAQPSIFTDPEGAGIPLENIARTVPAGSRSRVWLLRETPQDPIGIEGEIPMGGSDVWRQLPVPDPLRFTGLQLERALGARGIRISGRVVTLREPASSRVSTSGGETGVTGSRTLRILATVESPPLGEILRVVNKESNNFLAETVAKTLGRMTLGEGSFQGGARAVESFLLREVGVSPEDLRIRDGSGLSEENRASPGVFVQTLEFMAASTLWEPFLGTLPEAGVRRELTRMSRSPAAGNLKAKTGTLERVSALSGIVRTRSGERILFSILSNDVASTYRAKRAEDQIGIRLASLTRPLMN